MTQDVQVPQVVSVDAGTVFTGKATGNNILVWDRPTEYTPTANPNYMFPKWSGDVVAWVRHSKEPLFLFGPTGCGKTSCIKQIMTRLNYPVYEITGHSRLEFPEMVGHHTVIPTPDGRATQMKFEYGPVAMAMKTGGLLLVNEIDLLDPGTAAGLNSILDGYPLSIPENGGELIHPHPMFRFVATANSNGAGDETGLYQSVLRQNIAFMDRFLLVEAGYLDSKVEVALVKKHAPALPDDVVEKVVKFANAIRKLFVGDSAEGLDTRIEVTFSTRTILRWAYLIIAFEPLKAKNTDVVWFALERALVFRASKASQLTLRELYQRIF